MTCRLSRRLWAARVAPALATIAFMATMDAFATPLTAQETPAPIEVAMRGPRFLNGLGPSAAPIDPAGVSVLRRRVALPTEELTLEDALRTIAQQAGVRLRYSRDVVPLDARFRFEGGRISLAAALTEVLLETRANVDVAVTGRDQLVLVKRQGRSARRAGGTLLGRVTDVKTGSAVTNAEVFLERIRRQTMTDTMGYYRLAEVDTGQYTLTVRRLGYKKQSLAVTVHEGRADTVDVALEPLATRLDELVTTATGSRRRLDIANDVTTINADSIMQTAPIRSVTDLLEHRVPGLTVQRTSGAPGDPARLRLRGASSALRNNDPIVIVDGIRVYSEQSAARSGNLADVRDSTSRLRYAAPSPLDYMDPATIEKIEVLKGPSAATLYGQDAANGVIVITTKKGHAGPARWTVAAERGRTGLAGDYPDLHFRVGRTLYGDTPTLGVLNCLPSGLAIDPNGGTTPCQGDSVTTFQLLNDPNLTVLDHGNNTALSLAVSGGTSAVTYSVVGSYRDELGIIKLPGYELDRYQELYGIAAPEWMRRPQHYEQWGVTSNTTLRVGPQLSVTFRTSLSRTEQQRSSLEQQLGDLMGTYLDRTSGTYYRQNAPFTQVGASYGFVSTPLEDYYQRATAKATQFTNGAHMEWLSRPWLTITADAGLDVNQRADQVFFPRGPLFSIINGQGLVAPSDTTGYVLDGQGTAISRSLKLQASARRPLGRGFRLNVDAGMNYNGTSTDDINGGSKTLALGTSLYGIEGIGPTHRAATSDATFGWFIEPRVGNDKLSINTGLRLDGGSSYGTRLSGGLIGLPRLGFSYVVSEESWFPLRDLFQSFRVRATYGRAPRQPGPKDRLRLYTTPGLTFVEGEYLTATELASLGNTELRPERSAEFEGGIDADLLDSRLSVSVTGYRKTTDDALLPVPLAPSIYGDNVRVIRNIGSTRTTGVDLTVDAQVVRSGPITWVTKFLLSQRRAVVVALGPNIEPFYTEPNSNLGIGLPSGGIRIAPGYPLNGRWSMPFVGYADVNGDGILQEREIQLGDTAVYVGSTEPNYEATLATTISLWHGALTLDASLNYQDGLSQRNEVARRLSVFSAAAQVPGAPLDEQLATGNWGRTDYNWIQTVNTVRFDNFGVRYTVPTVLARRLGAQRLSVALQGANLGLWTNYRGLDPNVNAFGTGNNVTDTGVLPMPRIWQLRISASY